MLTYLSDVVVIGLPRVLDELLLLDSLVKEGVPPTSNVEDGPEISLLRISGV